MLGENRKLIIYKITNLRNGMAYIGQTRKTANRRWTEHCRNSRSRIGRAIQEFGRDAFKLEVLKTCRSLSALNKAEAYLILKHSTLIPSGYNVDKGGVNYSRHPTTGAKISEAIRGNVNAKGKPRSAETKARISASKKGVPISEEQIARLSAIHRGKPWTAARRAAHEARKAA